MKGLEEMVCYNFSEKRERIERLSKVYKYINLQDFLEETKLYKYTNQHNFLGESLDGYAAHRLKKLAGDSKSQSNSDKEESLFDTMDK